MSSMAKFFRGLAVPFKGFFIVMGSFKHICLAAVPFWLSLFFVVFAFWWFLTHPFDALPWLMQWVPGLFYFAESLKVGEFSLFAALLQGLFWVFLVVFLFYFSYILLSIIGAPFYSLLTDSILRREGVSLSAIPGIFRWLYTTFKMLIVSLMKLGFFVFLALVLFAMSFFPLGMTLVPLGISLMIAYDCLDFSFECMNYSLSRRFVFFRRHFAAFLGLAFIILAVGCIPGLFILTMPFFIAGGAELFAELHLRSENERLVPQTYS